MQKLLTALSFIVLVAASTQAQKLVQTDGIVLNYTIKDGQFNAKVKAPTQGWIAVGFNTADDIVGADLKMFRVLDGKAEAEDQLVTATGVHPADKHNELRVIAGNENPYGTTIQFSMPLNSGDKDDIALKADKLYYIILAYSTEDDFDHHSRVRKHLKFTL